MTGGEDITALRRAAGSGDEQARGRLVPMVYEELRRRAARALRGEREGHSLEPTELLHEVFVQLFRVERLEWKDRVHFFAVSSLFMRRILVDHARARRAAKREATLLHLEPRDLSPWRDADVLRVDEAIQRLAELDPRHAEIVTMRFFGGMSMAEVSEALGTPKRTLEAEWTLIRAWLRAELTA